MKVIAWPAYSNRQINPYTSLLYEQIIKYNDIQVDEFRNKEAIVGEFDIIHVHWPEAMLIKIKNPMLACLYVLKFCLAVKILKLKGSKLIWTIHNLKSHEDNFSLLRNTYFRWFVNTVDGVLVLSETTLELVEKTYPELLNKPLEVTPHGHYKNIYPNFISRQEARNKLGLNMEDTVFLFVGQIRRYKNLLSLISAFRETKEPTYKLVIAGLPDSNELMNEIQSESALDSRITAHLQFVSTDDMQIYLNSADALVLPYKEILNSGTAVLGLSFNKPLILPNKGAMAELKKIVGSEWVYTYEENISSTILLSGIAWLNECKRPEEVPLRELSWESISFKTYQFYKDVVHPHKN